MHRMGNVQDLLVHFYLISEDTGYTNGQDIAAMEDFYLGRDRLYSRRWSNRLGGCL